MTGSPSVGSSTDWRGGGSEGGSPGGCCCLCCAAPTVLLGTGDTERNVVLSTKPATRFSTDELPLPPPAVTASCFTTTKLPPPLFAPPPPLLLPPDSRWFMPLLDCWCCCCCCWSWPRRLRELALLPLPVWKPKAHIIAEGEHRQSLLTQVNNVVTKEN